MNTPQRYPGFAYSAKELYQFLVAGGSYFTIILEDGDIVHFDAPNRDDFLDWLNAHQIQDIRKLDGWVTR